MDNILISIVDVINDFKLYMREKNNKLILRKEPREGFFSNKIEKIKNDKRYLDFNEELNRFIFTIKSNFRKEDLDNFRKNIRSLQVYGVYFQLGDFAPNFEFGTFLGRYDMLANSVTIDLRRDREKSSIYHELLHMASTRRDRIRIASGFHYYKTDKVSYGRGLNEGYTELLTQRYFYNKDYDLSLYQNAYIYASLLERIVGKEKMESLYLNADINGLVHELEKYDSYDNILHFINELDYINHSQGIVIDTQRLKNISHFLIQSYMRKKLVNGESIYDNETGMDVYNFIKSVPTEVEIEGKKCKLNLSVMIDEIVNETFPENEYNHIRR